MKRSSILIFIGLLAACSLSAQVMPEQKSRLTIGGYGEITFTRNFTINTTPLWGRGLSKANTGAEDRLHDNRARNVVEAIMWHAYSKESDAYRSTEKFYYLSAEDRAAVVAFINAI